MTVVESRFSGGTIIIDNGADTLDPSRRLVTVDAPGFETALFPHEARELAQALQDAAAEADKRTARLRRDSAVDDRLRGLDD